ncbi:DUF2357 domain-containing protein [Methylococcus capsulatus]|uniref:DUF2357 domain-containing protein n=1 Tax=Methylococcus capsulatus TaxID=414 RepID=UPI001C52A074|nr:DUF2357 domain-containing protein [Methylococcus capsulatus]QXP93950.1 DUF2357 domain-containing protein [Methylococcus capsulatus]UQN11324.1 DUF2357 domain-containing protein [Methylococcus capsulatus]
MGETFFCRASRAVLITGEGNFPGLDENGWETLEDCAGVIEIDEWQTAYLRFYGEEPAQFSRCLNAVGAGRFERLPHHALPTYRINFQNHVGQSSLAGFRVKVVHRKITEEHFNAMLDFLCDQYATLIFSLRQIAGVHWRKDRAGRDNPYLQYLLIRRHLLHGRPDLDGIAALVHRAMHERMVSTVEETSIDRVRDLDSAAAMTLLSRPAAWGRLETGHPLKDTALARSVFQRAGRRLFPGRVRSRRRHATVDTPENRFVKFFLTRLEQRLAQIKAMLGEGGGTFLHPEMGDEIGRLERALDRFLEEPRWREVGELRHIPARSTVLQRRAGYRELFRLFALLQQASRHDANLLDFTALVEIKDAPLLYEYWCFFQVKQRLDARFGLPRRASIIAEAQPEEDALREGLRLDYGRGIALYYNATCAARSSGRLSSYSHDLRPDIILSDGDRLLILDAKYRGEASGDTGIESPNPADIDKMHTYREAIRNVWGAFVLYPGEKPEIHPAFTARGDSRYEGVGALVLVPGILSGEVDGSDEIERLIGEFLERRKS